MSQEHSKKAPMSLEQERRLFLLMAILSFVLVCLGFGNFYLARLLDPDESISPTIHIHGFLFFLWMIFFLLQNALVNSNKTATHMKLGVIGLVLCIGMLASAVVTTLEITAAGHRGIPGLMFSTPKAFLILNMNAIGVFVVLVLAGFLVRRKTDMHKRFMMMAVVIGLTPPAISRLPFVSGNELLIPLVVGAVVLALPLYEARRNGYFHPAYRISLPLVILILPPVVELIAQTV